MFRHIVTECYMIHAIFLDFPKGLENIFKMQPSNQYLAFQMSMLEKLEIL